MGRTGFSRLRRALRLGFARSIRAPRVAVESRRGGFSSCRRVTTFRFANIRATFSYPIQRGRRTQLVHGKPVAKLKRNSEATGDPEIWSPAQLARFLAVAMKHEPALVVGLAIKAFAGVRTAELLQLRWERISSDKIRHGGP